MVDRLHLWRCFRCFTLPVLEHCSVVWCWAADTHQKLQDRVVSGASFLSVTLKIVDQCRYVCCLRSGVNRCKLFMVLYLCQCGFQVVIWSHIGILVHILAADPPSTAGLLFPLSVCVTISLTLYSMVWDWQVSRAGPSCSLYFCHRLISHSHPSLYGFVLWGWGFWADSV